MSTTILLVIRMAGEGIFQVEWVFRTVLRRRIGAPSEGELEIRKWKMEIGKRD